MIFLFNQKIHNISILPLHFLFSHHIFELQSIGLNVMFILSMKRQFLQSCIDSAIII